MKNLELVEDILKKKKIAYELKEVDPDKLDIDSTVKHLGIKYKEGLATLLYKARGKDFVAVLRRDDSLFDLKALKKALGTSRVSFCSEEDIKELGFLPGLVSPVALNVEEKDKYPKIRVFVDKRVTEMDWAYCGSTSPNYALKIKARELLNVVDEAGRMTGIENDKGFEVIDISVDNPKRRDEAAPQSGLLSYLYKPGYKFHGKVSKDETKIDHFLNRGVDRVLPTKEALKERLMSGERLTAYMGFDPTGKYLTVGHGMGIRAMRLLQELGHRVIFLVGDYTARVGDPDKGATRKLLTANDIAENMAGWRQQAAQLIDFDDKENPVEFVGNFTWLHKLEMADIVSLMSKFTVQQMLERDLFQKRIAENKPLQLQELIYPLMQGYDSVAMQVDIELGGTDQIFNMLVGRDLVKNYLNKEKFVRAHELMPAPDGLTMSKTKGNGINLSDSAENMYGISMSYADEHILTGLRLLTDTSETELKEISAEINRGTNPMKFKKLMAFRIVESVKGSKEAEKAEAHFESTVQNKAEVEHKKNFAIAGIEESIKENDLAGVIATMINTSKTHARQLISQNGVEINGQKANLVEFSINPGDVIKIGKRNWFEITK